jgi:hypothetical protein
LPGPTAPALSTALALGLGGGRTICPLLPFELELVAGLAERAPRSRADALGAAAVGSPVVDSLSDASDGIVRFSLGREAPLREPEVLDLCGGGKSFDVD